MASTAQRPIETSHLTENPPIHSSQRNSLAEAAMQDPPILIDGASKVRSAESPQPQQEQPDDQTIVAVFPPLVLEDTINSQEHTFTGQSEPLSPLNPVMNQKPNRVYRKSQFSSSKVAEDDADLTNKLMIIKQNTQKEANKKHKNHHHPNGITKSLDFVTDGSPVGRLNQSYQATSSFF